MTAKEERVSCAPLPPDTRLVGNIAVFRPTEGKILDQDTIDRYDHVIYQMYVSRMWRRIIVDCECTEFINSAMVDRYCKLNRLLMMSAREKLRLCAVHPKIMEEFMRMNLDDFFSIHPDLESALASFTP